MTRRYLGQWPAFAEVGTWLACEREGTGSGCLPKAVPSSGTWVEHFEHWREYYLSLNTQNGRSGEHIITNDSAWPIDDLTPGEDEMPPAVGGTLIAPFALEVQPAKITGERIGVKERGDRVLRVPVNAAVRGDVL
jgi:hypothetical protein